MVLPILSYGHPILRSPCREVVFNEAGLNTLVDDLWHTMYNARGCGLAAPQVNRSLQLFVVDSQTTFRALKPEERPYYFEKDDEGIIETFINARIVESSDETWEEEEGCLSIPNLVKPVTRPMGITIEYYDRNFIWQKQTFAGTTARMVQHEFDHTKGILYVDYLKPLARKLLSSKLRKISRGLLPAKYLMTYLPK
ncbi:MAG: peptide deformylase [Chitinophagaceae bacterium]|nr:MAG: peptide deformylase [Chitinophagaceae bacterium]